MRNFFTSFETLWNKVVLMFFFRTVRSDFCHGTASVNLLLLTLQCFKGQPASFCWAHFLFNCHLLLGERGVRAIFSFSKPQVHLSSNKTSRKILSHLTQRRETFFWRKEKTILATMKLCLVLKDSKEDHKCTWGVCPWWKISFSAKKTFHIFTEWLSERLLVQMKLNTQKMKEKTTQIHLRPWGVFSKAEKNP